jgi:PAS domain S-box-containing protein
MVGGNDTKELVSTLVRSRAAVAESARTPDQQRLIGAILAEIDRAVAALDPQHGASAPLTPLDAAVQAPEADVEALRREVERLRALAQRERGVLETVLTYSPHGIIVSDESGRLVLHNRASERIWAGSATAHDVEGWGRYRAFHADGRPYEPGDWSMARSLSSGEVVDAEEVHFQRFDGTHGVLLGSAAPVYGPDGRITGAVSTFADITRFKELERDMRFIGDASAELAGLALDYEGTLDRVAHLAVPRLADWAVIDLAETFYDGPPGAARGGACGAFRRAAAAHASPSRASMAERLLLDHRLREETADAALAGASGIAAEVVGQMKEAAQDPDYEALLAKLGEAGAVSLPLRARDRTLGTMTLVCAESGRTFGPDEARLARQFVTSAALALDNAYLYRESQRVNRVKDEFLATLSHELRTPLHAVLGWARLLRSGKLDDAARARAFETIERNAAAQAQLIEDLLDVSRIISGKFRVEVLPVDLRSVTTAAIDAVRLAAESKGIQLVTRVEEVPQIAGDGTRLQQVVWNLLCNAIKFTQRGGRVALRLERVESHVEIEVADDGQGIRADFLPYVFERFRQADGTTTRSHGGLGLGLAIVRHLVELHGGSVRVQSEGSGRGAAFLVKLPIAPVRPLPEGGADAARWNGSGQRRLEGVRVLVVDDEADARDLVAAVLSEGGAAVVAVGSVPEAIEAAVRHVPDVLVSDIGMPIEDGYSLIRKIRAMGGPVARIPAAALTAYASVQDRTRALSAGYSSHLPKPIEPGELMTVVAGLAGRAAAG